MDYDLSPDQTALVKKVSEFCEKECSAAFDAELDQERVFPEQLYRKMADAGFLGALYPPEYGGSGGSLLDGVLIVEELAASSATAATIYLVAAVFGGTIVLKSGSDSQKTDIHRKNLNPAYRTLFTLYFEP